MFFILFCHHISLPFLLLVTLPASHSAGAFSFSDYSRVVLREGPSPALWMAAGQLSSPPSVEGEFCLLGPGPDFCCRPAVCGRVWGACPQRSRPART